MRRGAVVLALSAAALLCLGTVAISGEERAAAGPGPHAPRYPDHSKLLAVRAAGGEERPVRTLEDWRVRRAHILLAMEEVMGELASPEDSAGRPLDLRDEEPAVAVGGYLRRRISFASGPDDRVPAFLLIPREPRGRVPGILCLHQTTAIGKAEPAGLGGKESLHYAAHLAERGFVALAPDYPGFGDHRFDPYRHGFSSGTMKAIRDNIRGLDLLQSLAEVDPERLGSIGHSLGGHNAIFTAAFDERIKALVSSCGFTSFERYYGGDLTGWSSKTYMPRIPSYGGFRNMPFDFHEVVGALAPRAFLAVAPLNDSNFDREGVDAVISSARQVYRLLEADAKLELLHPDCGHEFPPEARERAYAFFERWLGKPPCPKQAAPKPAGGR
jgi:dienelactone hydrolase